MPGNRADGRQGVADFHLDTEFLAQFAAQAAGGVLTGLDLATGKFPLQRQAHRAGALNGEYQAVALDEGASDVEGLAARCFRGMSQG